MSLQTHVSKQESALTVEWARAQVFAWLAARTGLGRSAPAAPSNEEKEELRTKLTQQKKNQQLRLF